MDQDTIVDFSENFRSYYCGFLNKKNSKDNWNYNRDIHEKGFTIDFDDTIVELYRKYIQGLSLI